MPSTVIRRFAYHAASRALDIEFVGGRRYRYRDVPPEVAERFSGAFSKGRYFNAHVRDIYVFDELELESAQDPWGL